LRRLLNDIVKNLDKFEFQPHCGVYHCYVYKNVKIEVVNNIFFTSYYLYYNDNLLKLNFLESLKVKSITKKLEKIRENRLKECIIQEFN